MATSLHPPPATSRKALIGFLLTFLSLGLGFWIGRPALVATILGLVLAVLGLREIHRSQGGLGGRRLAKAGISGAFLSGLVILAVLPFVQNVRLAAHRTNSI